MMSFQRAIFSDKTVKRGRWRNPAALAAALALAVGGFVGQAISAPPAQAATGDAAIGNFWAEMNSEGGNFAGWYDAQNYLTQPISISRDTLYTAGYQYGLGSLPVDGNGLVTGPTVTTYGQPSYGGSATDNPPDPTGCDPAAPGCTGHTGGAPARATLPMWLSTLAVDANAAGTRSAAYAYSWTYGTITDAGDNFVKVALQTSGVTGIPDKMTDGYNTYNPTIQPMFRIADGQATSQYTAIPLPTYFGETYNNVATYNYWSGGEVIQQSGDVIFGGAELTCLADYPMMIFNPNNGDYNFSGYIQPATAKDAIFGDAAASCGYANGYVASDMALDANGNAYIIVSSNVGDATYGVPAGVTTDWVVRVIPGQGGAAWKYELVAPLSNADGNGTPPGPPGTAIFGMAFFNGSLYAASGTGADLIRINPMSGKIYNVPSGSAPSTFVLGNPPAGPQNPTPPYVNTVNVPTTYDMASGQTAMVVQGVVKDNGTGLPLKAQEVALYMKDPNNAGAWTLEGDHETNDSGDYVFLVAGNGQYVVRLINPTLADGAPAWQSSASVNGATNIVTAQCQAGGINGAGGVIVSTDPTTSGACYGAQAYGYADKAMPSNPLAVLGTDTGTQPSDMAMYASVTIATDSEVATADFGVSGVPDPSGSTLTLDKTSTLVNTDIKATAHIIDMTGNALPGAVVHFASLNGKTTITTQNSDLTCVTDASGDCVAAITSSVAGKYLGEIDATVEVGGPSDAQEIKNAPLDVEFTTGPPVDGPYDCGTNPGTGVYVTNSASDSLMSPDTPPVAVRSASTTAGGTLYVTGLVTDSTCTPIPNAPVTLTFDVSQAGGTVSVTPDLGTADAYTPYVLTGTTGADGKVTADLTDTKAGTVTITGAFDNTKTTPAGSPADTAAPMGSGTATWTAGSVDADSSYFTVAPAVSTLIDNAQWATVSDGTKADAMHEYTVTVHAMDAADDPLSGQSVTITPAGSKATTLNLSALVDHGDGSYTATIWSAVAQSDSTLSVTVGADPTNITMQMPKKNGGTQTVALVPFKTDTPSNTCTPPDGVTDALTPGLTADPSTDVPVGDATSAGSTLTATVTDEFCNPISGATVEFATDSATGQLSSAVGTTDGTGTVTTKATDPVAETTNPTATVTKDQDGAVISPSIEYATTVAFVAGPANPCDGLTPATTCTCPDPSSQTATNLSVNNPSNTSPIPSAMIPGKMLATAHITDQYCNIVKDGTSVAFSLTDVGSAIGSAYTGTANVDLTNPANSTTSNGDVAITIGDANAEQADVHATINGGMQISQSPRTIEFTVGDLDPANSTLVCTSKASDHTNVPNADGTDYWECVITAEDNAATPNRLSNLDVENFHITFANQVNDTSGTAQPVVAPSGVTNTGNGTYTFDVTSTKVSQKFMAAADYSGTPVGGPQQNAPTPFKAGPIDENTTCTVNGQAYKVGQVYASPNTDNVGGTSDLTVMLADKQCNAIQGALVTFQVTAPTPNSASIPSGTATTNLDGLAVSTVTDPEPETVTVGGRYDATNSTSGATLADRSDGIHFNDGTGDLTSDTTSLGGTAPAATGLSMVQFQVGDFSGTDSTFVCLATTTALSGNVPVVTDETNPPSPLTDYYRCTITAVDDQSPANMLKSQDTGKFTFTQSTNTARVDTTLPGADPATGVVNNGDGTYTVDFYSYAADAANTVTAAWNGVAISGSPTIVPTRIPFMAGQIDRGKTCTVNGQTYIVGQVYANPNTASVGGTSNLTVMLADENCNPITGAKVAFTSTGSGVTANPDMSHPAMTNADGLAASTVTDSKNETVTIGGTYDATIGATSAGLAGNFGSASLTSDETSLGGTAPAPTGVSMVQFTIGLPSSTLSQVAVSPVPQVAGTDVTVTVTVLDDRENPINNLAASDFRVSGAYVAGSGTAGTSPTFVVDQNTFTPLGAGVYTFQATSALVGAFNVTAMVETIVIDQQPQARFIAGAVCVDHCTPQNPNADNDGYTGFVVTLNQQAADGSATDVVTAFAYDTMGNPVPSAPVTLSDTTSATGLTGVLTPQTATATTGSILSGVNGQATLSFSATKAGSYTVSGMIGGLVPNANTTTLNGVTVQSGPGGTLSFIAGQVSAAQSKLIVSPLSQTVGSPVSVEVDVNDAEGNPVGDVAPTVVVDSAKASLSALTQTAPGSGVWTGTLNSTVAGTYQVTATVPTASGNQPVGGAGDPTKASPQTVTFTAGPICIAPACTVTPPTGVDPASVTTRVVVDPNGVVANGTAVDVATVYVFDQYGNPVPGASVATTAVESTLNVVKGSGTTDPVGAMTVGQTTLTYSSLTATAQHADVTVVDPLDATATSQAVPPSPIELDFVASAIDPANSTFTVTPNTPQAANTPFTLAVHGEDSNGNAVEGATITFSAGTGSTLSATTCKTDSSGDCSVTVNSTIAGDYQVGATAPDASGVAKPLGTATGDPAKTSPQTVTWTAGPICIAPACTVTPPTGVDPASVTTRVVVDPNGVANDGHTQDVATVAAFDQWGNPVIGATVASTATGSNAGDLNTQATINPTGTNGKTTIGYTSTVAGSYSANVTIVDPSNVAAGPQAVPPTPITLLFGSGLVDPDTSYFTVAPASPLTVGEDAANTYTVTVHANDAMAQPVEGAVMSFSTATGPVWGANPAVCTTAASGQCQMTVHSTVAGTYTVSVKAGSTVIAPQAAGGDQVVWQADDVCASGCTPEPGTTQFTTVAVGQDNMTADGVSQNSAIVHAYDKWGNPVSGVTVGVVPDATMDVVTSLSSQAYTDSTGAMTVFFTSTKAGAHTANFTVEKLTSTTQVPTGSPLTLTFVPGAADAAASTLTLSTHAAAVGDTVTATAQVNDKFGNAVGAGTTVTFTVDQNATLTAGTGTPPQTVTATTDASGAATATLTDPKADTGVNVHALIGTTDLGGAGDSAKASPQQVDFTAGGFSAANSLLTLTAQGTMTNGVPSVDNGRYSAVLTARDAGDNLIVNLDLSTISFASNNTGATAVAISSVMNTGSGTYTVTYTSKLADTQPDAVTPISGVTPLTASVTVDGSAKVANAAGNTDPAIHFVPGAPDAGPVVCPDPTTQTGSQFTVSLNSQTAGQTVTLKARVTDDQCNPIDGAPVTFTTDNNGQMVGVAPGDGTIGTAVGSPVGTAASGTVWNKNTVTVLTDPGNAWVLMTDYVAPDTTSIHATILSGLPLAPTDLNGGTPATSSPQTVTWSTDVPSINPVCPADSPYQQGTNISAKSPVTIPGQSDVDVLVTDKYCNPLPGVQVNLTIASATGSLSSATASTGDGTNGTTLGVATVKASDTVAEWTIVQATIPSADQPTAPVMNLKPTAGAPTRANPATGADIDFLAVGTASVDNPKPGDVLVTPKPEIDGTGAVPGDTIVVKDGNGNPIPGCDPVTAVNADGSWTCTPTSPIPTNPDGTTTVTPTQTDSSGDFTDGPSVAFTVDTTPPTITGPKNNSVTNDSTPTVTGTVTQPGSKVTVTDNGKPIPGCADVQVSATANADGTYNWTCTPTTPLPDGQHVLAPTVKDSEGNPGATGKPVTVNVDTKAPNAPTAKSDDGTKITGKAEPGTTITVTSDPETGKTVEGCVNVPVAADGTFSCTPTTKIPAGASVYVWAKDAAGNLSKPTQVTVPVPPAPPQVYVQTGGVPMGIDFGAIAAGLLGLTGAGLAVIAIRRRKEFAD